MRSLFISFLFLLPLFSFSQDLTGYIDNGVAVINQPVAKSQGIESIAAKYGVDPKEVLKINRLSSSSILMEGQKIKVPIGKVIKAECKGGDCIKVFHKVGAKEGLYRIGVNYGNIKMAQLKQLNNLKSESVSIGQRILVGYLTIPGGIEKTETATVAEAPAPAKKTSDLPVNTTVTASAIPAEKEMTVTPLEAKGSVETQQPLAVATKNVQSTETVDGNTLSYKGNGVFERVYKPAKNEATVSASSFKSTSGWADGKFYLLINNLPSGSIVKLINPATGNFIFAKVIGELPELKQDNKIALRLSNAGAAALGITNEENFQVTIAFTPSI